jgi:predicted amino acid-binding ACT domain protein
MNAYSHQSRSERQRNLAEQILRFRDEPVETLREVAVKSADGLKSLKAPVRAFAHSGVKLATVSQTAVQNLIELESEVVTSTLTAVATRFERAAHAEGVVALVFDQVEMLGATRERLVDQSTRAVEIVKVTGRDLRAVAKHTYEVFIKATADEVPEVKRAQRKVKRAVRKTTARARKATA